MSNCAISEIFGPTIQGEGKFTGAPSIFVRFSGCNLRCCFGNSICDTAYTSHKVEEPEFTDVSEAFSRVFEIAKQHPQVRHIVFTGGEPMLQQVALMSIINDLYAFDPDRGWHFTVETNGTVLPEPTLLEEIHLWSISPKLKNSCNFDAVNLPQTARKLHLRNMFNPQAIAQYIAKGASFQLKFVYDGERTESMIKEFLTKVETYIKEANDIDLSGYFLDGMKNPENGGIMLMPAGQNEDQINQNSIEAIRVCIENGWRFCDRTHIRIWGDKRRV